MRDDNRFGLSREQIEGMIRRREATTYGHVGYLELHAKQIQDGAWRGWVWKPDGFGFDPDGGFSVFSGLWPTRARAEATTRIAAITYARRHDLSTVES